jgi:hypothetical protein
MFSQIFPKRNMGRLCVKHSLLLSEYDQHCFYNISNSVSSISHQQAIAEHWDLPNTEIFQSKGVASDIIKARY